MERRVDNKHKGKLWAQNNEESFSYGSEYSSRRKVEDGVELLFLSSQGIVTTDN